jgi:hypothetical protein
LDIFLTEPGIGSIRAPLNKYSILTGRRVRTSCRNETEHTQERSSDRKLFIICISVSWTTAPYAFAWGLLVVVIADVVRRRHGPG